MAGSIPAKSGTRRSSSTSLLRRLTVPSLHGAIGCARIQTVSAIGSSASSGGGSFSVASRSSGAASSVRPARLRSSVLTGGYSRMSDPVEPLRRTGVAQHPETAQSRARPRSGVKSSTRVTVASCVLTSSAARARLTTRRSGRFTSARARPSFCCCASERRLPPLPISKAEPELDHGGGQAQSHPSSRAAPHSPDPRRRHKCRRCARRGRCPGCLRRC